MAGITPVKLQNFKENTIFNEHPVSLSEQVSWANGRVRGFVEGEGNGGN